MKHALQGNKKQTAHKSLVIELLKHIKTSKTQKTSISAFGLFRKIYVK